MINININTHYDALIVGARCAGAATAMLLARSGARVLLIDRQAYGSDRLSTHALMRGGVVQLQRWGLLERIRRQGTPPVRTTTFHYGDQMARVDIKPDQGVDCLFAPRRTVLDRVLVDAAVQAGATVRHGVSLKALRHDGAGRVSGGCIVDAAGAEIDVAADIVIGADGRQSMVARLVGAQAYRVASHATAALYGYFHDLTDDGYQWFYRRGVSAGAIPTNDDQHCVFACIPQTDFANRFRSDPQAGFRSVLAENSRILADAVDMASPVGALRGFAGAHGYLKTAGGPGWALVGDAGYFKDPLTAHGITDALRDAELLSRAVLQGSDAALTRYNTQRDRMSWALFDITERIASFEWDLDGIQALHGALNRCMKAEVAYLASYGSTIARAA